MLEHKPHNSHANAMTYAFLWFMQKPSVPCKNRQSMHFPRCAWIHGSTLMHGSMRFCAWIHAVSHGLCNFQIHTRLHGLMVSAESCVAYARAWIHAFSHGLRDPGYRDVVRSIGLLGEAFACVVPFGVSSAVPVAASDHRAP